ncbi:hypothetical protein FIBSPDRAFT_940473 [Athelia psychrophila]|uniref:Uncharacterized protein n=1 Tax=Athelia psychrophila TaxID=1759441 RepID=A0A167VUM3_9AGAM|nr:hypothetical protein FIBSPDRAFT_940473 [Fibularhizoctonia sp. CBS 109695]
MEPRDSYWAARDVEPESRLQHTQIAIYIVLGSLTAITWDWIISLAEEYGVVKRCGSSATVIAYFLARASAVTCCVLAFVFYTGVPSEFGFTHWHLMISDDDSCSGIMYGIAASVWLGNATKSYLFLLRVRAVYHDSNSKLAIFCVSVGAFVLVGLRIMGTLLIHTSKPLGNIGYCDVTTMGPISNVGAWFNVAYDTGIFVAISVRLTSHAMPTNTFGIMSLIRGYRLPRTMRHLIQDGQLYYFTVLAFILFAAICMSSPKVNPIYQLVVSVPATVMESNMACNIFRGMILRSPDVQQADSCSNFTRSSELDMSLVLRGGTTDMELEQICLYLSNFSDELERIGCKGARQQLSDVVEQRVITLFDIQARCTARGQHKALAKKERSPFANRSGFQSTHALRKSRGIRRIGVGSATDHRVNNALSILGIQYGLELLPEEKIFSFWDGDGAGLGTDKRGGPANRGCQVLNVVARAPVIIAGLSSVPPPRTPLFMDLHSKKLREKERMIPESVMGRRILAIRGWEDTEDVKRNIRPRRHWWWKSRSDDPGGLLNRGKRKLIVWVNAALRWSERFCRAQAEVEAQRISPCGSWLG